MRITKRACEELAKPDSFVKRTVHWDDEQRGFGVRVNGKGRLSFVVKYMIRGFPQQLYFTLGEWPAVAPDTARTEAMRIKVAAAAGQDLVADRREAAAATIVARQEEKRRAFPVTDLLDQWRESTEEELARKQGQGRSVSYERELLRLEAKVLRPAIAKFTVTSLDPMMFQALIEVQPSVNSARNLRNLLVRFIRHARARLILQGLTVHWPASFEINRRPPSRSFRYSIEEAARIWIAAGALGRRGALIRLMLLTGCRRIEAQKVERAHLVLEDPVSGPYWGQPSHLTKNDQYHRVPLSEPAVALLRWLPPRILEGGKPSSLIFAGRGGKLVGDWTVLRRAMLDRAGLKEGTFHDFRRTIVSTLGDHGFDPQIADSLLNHAAANSMSGVMSVYQRSAFWERKREAINVWTGLLMGEVAKLKDVPLNAALDFDRPFQDVRLRKSAKMSGRVRPHSSLPTAKALRPPETTVRDSHQSNLGDGSKRIG